MRAGNDAFRAFVFKKKLHPNFIPSCFVVSSGGGGSTCDGQTCLKVSCCFSSTITIPNLPKEKKKAGYLPFIIYFYLIKNVKLLFCVYKMNNLSLQNETHAMCIVYSLNFKYSFMSRFIFNCIKCKLNAITLCFAITV